MELEQPLPVAGHEGLDLVDLGHLVGQPPVVGDGLGGMAGDDLEGLFLVPFGHLLGETPVNLVKAGGIAAE